MMLTIIAFAFGMMAMFGFAQTAYKYPHLSRWLYAIDIVVTAFLLATLMLVLQIGPSP